ncbi:hypothetical protein [Variovorax sp. LjRoot178]|uniref:hypothetical protein n=1 Tax=Variovorax sp. LjRoot178 TaxID=3342277 RepID=UPI003ECE731B
MKHSKIVAGIAMALTTLVLAGCGTGPSESEIAGIIKKEGEQAEKQMKAIGASGAFAKNFIPTVHSVKKIGCEKEGSGVLCDLELDIEQGGQRAKNVIKQRFVKGSDGWTTTK